MNKQIRRLGIGLMVLFTALFVQLNLVQVVRADRADEGAVDPDATRERQVALPRGADAEPTGHLQRGLLRHRVASRAPIDPMSRSRSSPSA